MTPESTHAKDVRNLIDNLIQSAANAQFDLLESLYHDAMKIYMLDGDNNLHIMDKRGFIEHLHLSAKNGSAPSTWAKYHIVEADEKNAHVVISRKVNLTGEEKQISLSIDFIHENDRWQITREMIFAG